MHGGDNKTNEKPYGMVQKYVCTTEVDNWVYRTRLKPQPVSDLSPFFFTPLTVSVACWDQCRAFQMSVMTVMLMF